MAKRQLTTDQADFVAMLAEESPHLAKMAREKMARSHNPLQPQDVATLLRAYAARASGWCVGRFGA